MAAESEMLRCCAEAKGKEIMNRLAPMIIDLKEDR
jgi:hypothetical protein